jgi:hypothetical protein
VGGRRPPAGGRRWRGRGGGGGGGPPPGRARAPSGSALRRTPGLRPPGTWHLWRVACGLWLVARVCTCTPAARSITGITASKQELRNKTGSNTHRSQTKQERSYGTRNPADGRAPSGGTRPLFLVRSALVGGDGMSLGLRWTPSAFEAGPSLFGWVVGIYAPPPSLNRSPPVAAATFSRHKAAQDSLANG